MRRIITTYVFVVLLLSLGFFGVGAIASAAELRDPMQPPPFALQKFRQAKWAKQPRPSKPKVASPFRSARRGSGACGSVGLKEDERAMKICVVGAGYVGLVTGACLADFGLEVTGVDIDRDKVASYGLDLRTVRRSCVHIAHPDGRRIIPFDTYNILYRDGLEDRLLAPLRAAQDRAWANS